MPAPFSKGGNSRPAMPWYGAVFAVAPLSPPLKKGAARRKAPSGGFAFRGEPDGSRRPTQDQEQIPRHPLRGCPPPFQRGATAVPPCLGTELFSQWPRFRPL